MAEVYVGFSAPVKKGAPIFKLDSSKQEAAAETARRKITEVDADMNVARIDVLRADAQIEEAKSNHQQTIDELEAKQELQRRNPGNVPFREIERLQVRATGPIGRDHGRDRHEERSRRTTRDGSSCGQSQRGSRIGGGGGRSGEDGRSCGRGRARRAVPAPRGRYCQSD